MAAPGRSPLEFPEGAIPGKVGIGSRMRVQMMKTVRLVKDPYRVAREVIPGGRVRIREPINAPIGMVMSKGIKTAEIKRR
jgi:hypothetical protein